MSLRRVASVLTVVLASTTFVAAAPKADAKKAPVAPAKDPAPTPAEPAVPAADSGATGGSSVEMTEDPAPADMEGTNENPDAPKTGDEDNKPKTAAPDSPKRTGYPTEEVFRPITLPQNMSEVSLDLHAIVSPYTGAATLRGRYGITRQVQLGLTYLTSGIFKGSKFGGTGGTKIHAGKAVGLDLTVLLTDFLGVKVGVPFYVDPVAVGLTLGAPLRFRFFNKISISGLEDLVNIRLTKFVPHYDYESTNYAFANGYDINTTQSRGYLNFAGTLAYQYNPLTAFTLHAGVRLDDFSSTRTDAGDASGSTTFLRVGFEYTAKTFFDIGGSLGFADLAHGGTFGPQFYVAARI